jgi:hypothetical protein
MLIHPIALSNINCISAKFFLHMSLIVINLLFQACARSVWSWLKK